MAKRTPKSVRGAAAGRTRLLFLTNRANVLPALSSGLIRPRAAYDKYYEDLLALCPGQVPLFHGHVPRSLVPLVSGGGEGLFPVVAELDNGALGDAGRRQRITQELTPASGADAAGGVGTLCELAGEPLPIAAVKRLCFATQDDLDDFLARDFENVPQLPPLVVADDLFSDGGPTPDRFAEALRAVPTAAGTAEDFRRLDAAMGAVAMLSLLLPAAKPWLDALAATASFPSADGPTGPAELHWLSTLVRRVVSADAGDTLGGADGRLMAAAVDLLRSANPREGWVESRVIGDIAARALDGAAPEEAKEIESWRDVVAAVARADKQVGALDDGGSVVRRGLMLLVLRCQPERIIRTAETPLRPGPQVTAVAGMLSGLFHGYSRLSRDIKAKGSPAGLLSRLAVCWWSGVDGVPRRLAVATEARAGEEAAARIAVTVDRAVLVERLVRPDDAMMRLYYQAKSVGFSCEYDPAVNAFVYQPGTSDGRKRRILIEPGRPTPRGQATIRVRTVCLGPGGTPVRLTKKEDAVALLERNHDPVTQCRFAVEPGTCNVEVLVHQLLDTMDSPELQSHVEAVDAAACDFEATLSTRPAPARKTARSKGGAVAPTGRQLTSPPAEAPHA